jgi:hypothetical protein
MNAWRVTNLVVGHVLFAVPAAAALPALGVTTIRFGLVATLTWALLPALFVLAPWLLWLRYTRRRPVARRARLTWLAGALLVSAATLASPVWIWSLPVLVLLASETTRCLVDRPAPAAAGTAVRVRTA